MPLKNLLVAFTYLNLSLAVTFTQPASGEFLVKHEGDSVARRQVRKQVTGSKSNKCPLSRRASSSSHKPAGDIGSPSDTADAQLAIESLVNSARNQGSLQIIVGLCVEFVPEGKLNPKQVRAQRQAIAKAQNNLLRRLFAYRVTLVKKYEFIPFIAMRVNADALRFLNTSAQIRSIEEDTQASPTN